MSISELYQIFIMTADSLFCPPAAAPQHPISFPGYGGWGWGGVPAKPPLVGYGRLRYALIVCVRKLQKLIQCHDKRIAQNTCDIKANTCKIEALQAQVDALQQTVQQNTCKIQTNIDDIASNKDTLCCHEAWLRYIARTTCYIDDFHKDPPSNWSIGFKPWNGWA